VKITSLPRVVARFVRFVWVIVSGLLAIVWFLRKGRGSSVKARISWMQWMSRRFLALLHCDVEVTGVVPEHGLIAANHLGYVDILVIGSVCPAIFVAKSDVREWPVFGWLTRNAGTIFVSRDTPAEVPAQLKRMEAPLREGTPVVLFPEGTSSDGSRVLLLRSSLLESAVRSGKPVTPAAISYDLGVEGNPGMEIAYWGEATLAPHLINLLSKQSFEAKLRFGETRPAMADRKKEASRLHAEISDLLNS
jgi:1-acyl-sn-glycerol-3-phosphate acyltransferase